MINGQRKVLKDHLFIHANQKVIAKLREIEGRSIRKIQRERGIKVKFKSTEDLLEKFTISREKVRINRKECSNLE